MTEYLSKKELLAVANGETPPLPARSVKTSGPVPASSGAVKSATDAARESVLTQIEWHVENAVREGVRKRKDGIPDLREDPSGCLAYRGGELAPGCAHCLAGQNISLRHSAKCNLDCKFCYYKGEVLAPPLPPHLYGLRDGLYDLHALSVMMETQDTSDRAIGWVFHEPFCEEEKMYPAMEIFARHGLYQYLYTNGTLVTEDNLKRLRDAGLNEIRFDLAATNCSDRVLERVAQATRHFETVCCESPVFTDYAETFTRKHSRILDTGVTHLHFAELQVTSYATMRDLWVDEGPVYRHHGRYVSPVKSRHLIYDIFEMAVEEGWQGVTLHDCSNDVKLYRGAAGATFGSLEYAADTFLTREFYVDAIERYDLENKIPRE